MSGGVRALYAYVGSRTTRERNARGEGITVWRVDARSGALERVQRVGGLVNPSYLLLAPGGERLYCVHGDQCDVSSFAVNRATGHLAWMNTQPTGGRNPVHLALHPQGRHLVVTNHLGMSLAVFPVGDDGALQPLVQLVQVSGEPGPHRQEQPHAKPHYADFDASGRFLVVPDKGADRVWCHTFDAERGRLGEQPAHTAVAREGAGPRHFAWHPSQPWAYVLNELDSTVTAYRFDARTGALQPFHWRPTLPPEFTGDSRGAGIRIDAAGRFLYASNRGHDSIAVFRIDAADGTLRFEGADPTQGRTPRFFTPAPGGEVMFALNEDSDSIVALKVDARTGRLTPLQPPVACGSPVCMVFSAD